MKTVWLYFRIILYYFFILLPCAAFVEGYRFTGFYFRKNMIPFPFEDFGIVTAFGCFFWALGLLLLVWTLCQKRRDPS